MPSWKFKRARVSVWPYVLWVRCAVALRVIFVDKWIYDGQTGRAKRRRWRVAWRRQRAWRDWFTLGKHVSELPVTYNVSITVRRHNTTYDESTTSQRRNDNHCLATNVARFNRFRSMYVLGFSVRCSSDCTLPLVKLRPQQTRIYAAPTTYTIWIWILYRTTRCYGAFCAWALWSLVTLKRSDVLTLKYVASFSCWVQPMRYMYIFMWFRSEVTSLDGTYTQPVCFFYFRMFNTYGTICDDTSVKFKIHATFHSEVMVHLLRYRCAALWPTRICQIGLHGCPVSRGNDAEKLNF